MNFLGHPFVAEKATNKFNSWLIAGSHLPDIWPFLTTTVFSFEEIHESPDKLWKYLQKNAPEVSDLALGMMTHSVKFGADRYNREIENWLLDDKPEFRKQLVDKIVECSKISYEVADKWRLHNYLWIGVDAYLLKNESDFVKKLEKIYPTIDREKISDLLSKVFNEDFLKVKDLIDRMFIPLIETPIDSIESLAKAWKVALSGLPEKDQVDEEKAIALFEEIYERFKEKWPGILSRVIKDTKKSLKPFV